jgi:hypothetical protein
VRWLIEVLGWLGAAALLLAYGLASTGRLPAEGARFQLLNLGGAVALTANSAYNGAWPSAALNVVWIVIGLAALLRARGKARNGPEQEIRAALGSPYDIAGDPGRHP